MKVLHGEVKHNDPRLETEVGCVYLKKIYKERYNLIY